MGKFVVIGERIHCISPVIRQAMDTMTPDPILKRAKEQLDITLKIKSAAKKLIAEAGTDRKYGARPLKCALQTKLEDPLTEAILNGEIKRSDLVETGVSKNEIKFSVKETKN